MFLCACVDACMKDRRHRFAQSPVIAVAHGAGWQYEASTDMIRVRSSTFTHRHRSCLTLSLVPCLLLTAPRSAKGFGPGLCCRSRHLRCSTAAEPSRSTCSGSRSMLRTWRARPGPADGGYMHAFNVHIYNVEKSKASGLLSVRQRLWCPPHHLRPSCKTCPFATCMQRSCTCSWRPCWLLPHAWLPGYCSASPSWRGGGSSSSASFLARRRPVSCSVPRHPSVVC